VQFTEARVIGGGSASRLWNQIKADVLGVPYVQLNQREFAVLGAAVVAGHAVGLFPDIKATVQSFVQPAERVEPQPEQHAYYERMSGPVYFARPGLGATSRAGRAAGGN
jgi:xylulokinase